MWIELFIGDRIRVGSLIDIEDFGAVETDGIYWFGDSKEHIHVYLRGRFIPISDYNMESYAFLIER